MEEKIDRRDITDADVFVMGKGEWYRSFEKMGAHPDTRDGQEGFRFSVWVPDVRSVHVIGDFNDWDIAADPLEELPTGGIWCGFVAGAKVGDLYK